MLSELRAQEASITASQAKKLLQSLAQNTSAKTNLASLATPRGQRAQERRASLRGGPGRVHPEKAERGVLDLTDPNVRVEEMTSDERALIKKFKTASSGFVTVQEFRSRYELFVDCDLDETGLLHCDEVVAQMERLLNAYIPASSQENDKDDAREEDNQAESSSRNGGGRFSHGMDDMSTGERRGVVLNAIKKLGVQRLSFKHILMLAYPRMLPAETSSVSAFFTSAAEADLRKQREAEAAAKRAANLEFAKELFEVVDGDGSGEIDIFEFRELIMQLKHLDATEEQATQMFHEIDADGGGTIDLEEFQEWWVENDMGS